MQPAHALLLGFSSRPKNTDLTLYHSARVFGDKKLAIGVGWSCAAVKDERFDDILVDECMFWAVSSKAFVVL